MMTIGNILSDTIEVYTLVFRVCCVVTRFQWSPCTLLWGARKTMWYDSPTSSMPRDYGLERALSIRSLRALFDKADCKHRPPKVGPLFNGRESEELSRRTEQTPQSTPKFPLFNRDPEATYISWYICIYMLSRMAATAKLWRVCYRGMRLLCDPTLVLEEFKIDKAY